MELDESGTLEPSCPNPPTSMENLALLLGNPWNLFKIAIFNCRTNNYVEYFVVGLVKREETQFLNSVHGTESSFYLSQHLLCTKNVAGKLHKSYNYTYLRRSCDELPMNIVCVLPLGINKAAQPSLAGSRWGILLEDRLLHRVEKRDEKIAKLKNNRQIKK